ncbi:MAG: peptidoglycan-binding protein [Clostridia bacterium]|nr:peptidoglycan-binding protein [Clostridia bacterium]
MPQTPIIPQSITVHLGPPDQPAENVTLPFLEYVANVASSEIYPTWPENAIRANMYAQISYALNRVYTEYYRTRGYDFDITSTTAFDQFFVHNRDIFDNIRQIAGELFNDYIRRAGSIEPLFAQYCNGTTVTCNGLSQWGSVELAEQGYTPYEILQFYYGDDIELVRNAPIAGNEPSAPTVPLRLGSVNNDVRTLQIRLNRIANNYPSIPKIVEIDGIFGTDTEAAVRRFQEIFSLTPDGIVGPTTWYTVQNIYIGVKRLNDLNAEGITLNEVTQQFPEVLQLGDSGSDVRNMQYYIAYVSQYYDTIPLIAIDGVYGESTQAAVRDVQSTFGLPADGIMGEVTWNQLYRAYLGIVNTIPLEFVEGRAVPFGGVPLRVGADSESVRLLQEYLNVIAGAYPSIPSTNPTGYFGPRTQEAVIAFQNEFGLPATGVVNAITWTEIAQLFETLTIGGQLRDGQYPGFELGT